MTLYSFEEIMAWQETRAFNKVLRLVFRKPNVKNDYIWIDQISRATLSVMSNIAEGNDADSNPEFARFLSYAKRSAAEVRSQLYYGFDVNYISKEEFEDLQRRIRIISGQLTNLIQHLRKNPKPVNVSTC